MIDDLEAFIAEHRAKVSRDKQERKTEPRASTVSCTLYELFTY